jgi:hypothetical protein
LVLEDEPQPLCTITELPKFIAEQLGLLSEKLKNSKLEAYTGVNLQEQKKRCLDSIENYFDTATRLKKSKLEDEKQKLYNEYYERINKIKEHFDTKCCNTSCGKVLLFDDHRKLECGHNCCYTCCFSKISLKHSSEFIISCPECNYETFTQTKY